MTHPHFRCSPDVSLHELGSSVPGETHYPSLRIDRTPLRPVPNAGAVRLAESDAGAEARTALPGHCAQRSSRAATRKFGSALVFK
ncbi:hypothetical protein [Azospirillum doebereinerae]